MRAKVALLLGQWITPRETACDLASATRKDQQAVIP